MIEKGEIQVQIAYEGKPVDKVEALKKYYGIQSDVELVRILVNEQAGQLNVSPTGATTGADR